MTLDSALSDLVLCRSSIRDCVVSIPVQLVHLRLSVQLQVMSPTETLMILQWLDVLVKGRRSTEH